MATPQSLLPRLSVPNHSVQTVLTLLQGGKHFVFVFVCLSTVSHATLGLVWDSNPDVLKGPTPSTPILGKCHSAPPMKGLLTALHGCE